MNARHLWTIQWTQPYATNQQRPYLRGLQEQLEALVETWLEQEPTYPEANVIINRIKNAKK